MPVWQKTPFDIQTTKFEKFPIITVILIALRRFLDKISYEWNHEYRIMNNQL